MGNNQWTYDEALRKRLEDYIPHNRTTQSAMAARLKLSSASRLSKYLNLNKGNEPEPDMERIEKAVLHFFRHEDRIAALTRGLFESSVTKVVGDSLRRIRKTGDVGLIHGKAGIGKSCAAAYWKQHNPDVHLLTGVAWRQGPRDIEDLLFHSLQEDPAALERPYPNNVRRTVWMEDLFRGSERMIIIDTAQRLHITAFQWLFDFHDVTGAAVALIGNPELLNSIRPNDQLFSRIGLVREVTLNGDMEAIAIRMIEQYCPAGKKDLVDAAVDVLGRPGHGRTLRKQLILTPDIYETMDRPNWGRAFEVAATMLVKPPTAPQSSRRKGGS